MTLWRKLISGLKFMSQREPCTTVEIDLDYCTRTFGVAPCNAALGGDTVRKCYNTWATCKFKSAYNKGTNTLKFCEPNSSFPVGLNYIPALENASGRSGTVNIAGSDDKMGALGVRAEVQASFVDFADGDKLTDKYWSERISGAAQIDEGGYDPKDRLSFWAKLKARNPNYAGRPMRIVQGYVDDGIWTPDTTRNYIMSEWDGPSSRGGVKISAKDILTLADDEKAVAPAISRGFLSEDIDETTTEITLLPSGIGSEYSISGWAVIGAEIVSFERSGDVMTIVRGTRGTEAATHSVNDTVQETYSCRRRRIDAVIYDLLVNYANVPASYITFADWQAEVNRWAGQLVLTADICKPEGVKKLLGEIAVLGVSIWWDDVNQKIRLRMTRPEDDTNIYDVSDDFNIINITQEDMDEDRLTRVSFSTVQIDPTKALNSDNFLRTRILIDVDAESAFNYDSQSLKTITCRWLNHGDDALVRILSKRILNRFNRQPVRFKVELDYKDNIELASVMRLSSRIVADESGKPANTLMQVISRNDKVPGHSLTVETQKFQFDGRYAFICENSRPDYNSSSAAQKSRGAYFVDDGTLLFSDGTGPYVFA